MSSRHLPGLAARALIIGIVLGVLALLGGAFAVSLATGRFTKDGGSERVSEQVTLLQTSASPTAVGTPVSLSSQQIDCLKFFGGVQAFQRLDTGQQNAVLNTIQDCVNGELGLPPAQAPPSSVPGANSQAVGPFPTPAPLTRAGAGFIGSKGWVPSGGGADHFLNNWSEESAQRSIVACAGNENTRDKHTGAITDASQGILAVFEFGPHGKTGHDGYYRTPGKDGAVRITNAVGETLELKAEDGTLFYFDVASRQFVSALPAASATPAHGRGDRGGADVGASSTPQR